VEKKIINLLIKIADDLDRSKMESHAAAIDEILSAFMPFLEGAKEGVDELEQLDDSSGEEPDEELVEYPDPEVGDMVEDINPECPHFRSIGVVTSVSGKSKDKKEATYLVINEGEKYSKGDELTKTFDQLTVLEIV
tara:strand:- start:203 stop:610 length:408 start_codon:yes stop_codon:yes gene_type:complete